MRGLDACVIAVLAFSSLPRPLRASEAVREIDQASVQASGGFPVLLTAGSYSLTGDLVVPDLTTTAIRGAGDGVALDLRGFSIRGPNTCGTGACSNDSGLGIEALPGVRGTRVANGRVSGTGGDCIQLGESAQVEEVVASSCGGDGISVAADSRVAESRAYWNAGDGIQLGTRARTERNIAFANAQAGGQGLAIRGALGGAPNVCDDQSCSSGVEHAYYLSPGAGVPASQALGRCDPGFHMAALFEIQDPSALVYDRVRGKSLGDGHPPSDPSHGWIRTGHFTLVSNVPGRANCENWTQTGLTGSGTGATFNSDWIPTNTTPPTSRPLWPWRILSFPCTELHPVWCVQD